MSGGVKIKYLFLKNTVYLLLKQTSSNFAKTNSFGITTQKIAKNEKYNNGYHICRSGFYRQQFICAR